MVGEITFAEVRPSVLEVFRSGSVTRTLSLMTHPLDQFLSDSTGEAGFDSFSVVVAGGVKGCGTAGVSGLSAIVVCCFFCLFSCFSFCFCLFSCFLSVGVGVGY